MSYRFDIYDLTDTDEPVATVEEETAQEARAAAQKKVRELRRSGTVDGPVQAKLVCDSGTVPTPGERRKAQAIAALLVVCCVAALVALFSM